MLLTKKQNQTKCSCCGKKLNVLDMKYTVKITGPYLPTTSTIIFCRDCYLEFEHFIIQRKTNEIHKEFWSDIKKEE